MHVPHVSRCAFDCFCTCSPNEATIHRTCSRLCLELPVLKRTLTGCEGFCPVLVGTLLTAGAQRRARRPPSVMPACFALTLPASCCSAGSWAHGLWHWLPCVQARNARERLVGTLLRPTPAERGLASSEVLRWLEPRVGTQSAAGPSRCESACGSLQAAVWLHDTAHSASGETPGRPPRTP